MDFACTKGVIEGAVVYRLRPESKDRPLLTLRPEGQRYAALGTNGEILASGAVLRAVLAALTRRFGTSV